MWNQIKPQDATPYLSSHGKVRVSGVVRLADGTEERLDRPVAVREIVAAFGTHTLHLATGEAVTGGVLEAMSLSTY